MLHLLRKLRARRQSKVAQLSDIISNSIATDLSNSGREMLLAHDQTAFTLLDELIERANHAKQAYLDNNREEAYNAITDCHASIYELTKGFAYEQRPMPIAHSSYMEHP